jgi:uncharacterized protein YyaL (SSP411 family)
MGDLSGVTTPHMDWHTNDLPTAFNNFCQYVELVFKGPFAKKEATEKVTYLLLWLGQEGITIYNSWSTELTEEEKKDHTKIMEKFKAYFAPKTNFRIERFQLQQYTQREKESCDDFLTRCKTQACKCKFNPDELDERLIEQLIKGTKHNKIQQSLLKDEKITLNQAMNEARTYESSLSHMSQLAAHAQNDSRVNVDAMPHRNRAKCDKCGYDAHKKTL